MARRFSLFLMLVLVGITSRGAHAQAVVTPTATPTPAPLPVTGPSYGVNDPCTSVGAIVSRPTQTTSVCTVRPGRVLIETGYQNLSTNTSTVTAAYPQTAVRIGTSVPALEVDLGMPAYERLNVGGDLTTGTTDIGAGLKYVVGYSARFNYGANVYFTTPSGTSGISAGASTQTYNFNYGYVINSTFALAGTVGAVELPDGGRRYRSLTPSILLTAGLPNATGWFVEAAEFTNGAGLGTPSRLQVMTGLTRSVGNHAQVDLEVGRSAIHTMNDSGFIGFGLSRYF